MSVGMLGTNEELENVVPMEEIIDEEQENGASPKEEKMIDEAMNMNASQGTPILKKKKRGKKRKLTAEGPASKKLKSNDLKKNALMELNELYPGLDYILEDQRGPDHQPCFVVSVRVKDAKFTGVGGSKQLAKHEAAKAALSSLRQLYYNPESAVIVDQEAVQNFVPHNSTANGQSVISDADQKNYPSGSAVAQIKLATKLQKFQCEADTQNPVKMLNELRPGVKYVFVKENSSTPNRRFVMCATIDDCDFEASGASKKAAKAAVARSVLSKLYNIKFSHGATVVGSQNANILIDKSLLDFSQSVADKMAKSLDDTFAEAMVKNVDHKKWKVLAGFIMTSDANMESMEVVCFATGTKHLNGEYMSMNGGVLSDCHAEIISRRCLKDFFYSQLELHANGKGDLSIFYRQPNGKFALLPNLKFHLFISTSPCGDARIFSVHSEDSLEVADIHPNRKARGLLRTKIESGEGTIPVKMGMEDLTWDGILEGQQRYLNMSCSDKIASWNVLGLQGSLLSNLIEPIYMESIVLGRLFHAGHLYRALCGRYVTTLQELPAPYRLHKPKMCSTTTLEIRQLNKSPNFSVNWTIGINAPEVIVAKTGKLDSGQVSRLAKRSFFQRFCSLHMALEPSSNDATLVFPCTYAMAKKLNQDYVRTKELFVQAFSAAELGIWVRKPSEEEEFEVVF